MTPIQLQDSVLTNVGEPEGVFHTRDSIRTFVQQAEQLLGMLRGTTEKTFSLPLTLSEKFYALHAAAPDFIFPLRVTVLKKQLYPTTLSKVSDRDPGWASCTGIPHYFFMIGTTHIGFYPLSPSNTLNAVITYIAQPPITFDAESYFSNPEWHEAYVHYVAGILLAKEQKYAPAGEQLNMFLTKSGLVRDPRFSGAEVRGERANILLHPPVEAQVG